MSKIKHLQELLQQVQEAAEQLGREARTTTKPSLVQGVLQQVQEVSEQLGREARNTFRPSLVSAYDILTALREEAVSVARDTTKDVKQEVDQVMQEVGDFFRAQGLDVQVIKYEPKPDEKLETPEDFVAAVERLMAEADRDDLVNDERKYDSVGYDELVELVDLQDRLIEDQAAKIERLETQLQTQANIFSAANARCTGFHEGILSALELIDQLDIIRAKEHLRFTLRQAGVSDCDLSGPRGL